MAKRDMKKEKRLRNEEYAKKFQKYSDDEDTSEKKKKKGGNFGSWCRTGGHDFTCDCAYE